MYLIVYVSVGDCVVSVTNGEGGGGCRTSKLVSGMGVWEAAPTKSFFEF